MLIYWLFVCMVLLAAICWTVAATLHSRRHIAPLMGKATVRCRAGVFEAAIVGTRLMLPEDRSVEPGESIRIEFASPNGSTVYRVRALTGDGEFDLASAIYLGREERRASKRQRVDAPCLIDAQPATLIDVSELGARLATSEGPARGSRVLLEATALGDEPVGAWVLADKPECRLRFEEPVQILSRR